MGGVPDKPGVTGDLKIRGNYLFPGQISFYPHFSWYVILLPLVHCHVFRYQTGTVFKSRKINFPKLDKLL